MPEIAFIVGMGRSGTTLLSSMLNSNPSVVSTPENEFIVFAWQSFKNKDFGCPAVCDEFVSLFNFNFNKVISIWKPGEKLRSDMQQHSIQTFADACKLVYLNYPFVNKNPAGIKCIVDKNPAYSLYLDKLNVTFPDARYILLVRDFRDNVLSRKKYADSETSIYELAASWNFYYDKIFDSIHALKLNYQLLKYEDLVKDPEATLKKLCSFLSVDYTPGMLNYQDLSKKIKEHVKENKEEQVYDKINKMHANLDNKVNISRVNAYENELSAEEIAILDYVCSGYGKQFGYLEKGQETKM